MPTASKSADIIRMEGKSHRTKKELRQREQAEKALLTGIPLKERQEVKDNEIAHKEFLRLKKLLEKINKFDDMYVNKKKSTGKVDEVVALINAMYLLQQYLLNGDNFVAQTA